ncbi:MAG: macrolide ABC transporter ATP-binding protein [Caulobacter vibrioides]|uniref:Macrolide ABC transporter ATP-binding protein n=1 Tax=Caulobacter vibrioides TaxID=155892 RepID=A0A258CY51_CAUVI|nr:MAG: macrolide ABC transporter ATP-binding protein [Caulobacter vibrioides]
MWRATGVGSSFAGAGVLAALVGSSGSGKSTLLNIMGLLDKADSGRILFDGCPVSALNATDAARLRNELIGFVFQSFHLLSRLTAWENVALPLFHRGVGRLECRARAMTMLEQVGLADRSSHRPEQMSGGQRQRVAIARALVGEPRLILADEPTGNLDSATGLQVMGLLRQLNRDLGVTILMVTHDRDMARLCDRVIEIRDGRVLPQEEQR